MALLHRLFSASLLALLASAAVQTASAQCATVYSNIASDGAGNVHAWTILTDNYTNIGSGCAPPLWVTYGFHHTYSTSVTITSPSHRTVTTTGSGSQLGGSATGTVRTDASLPMASEQGTFTESGFDSITCSIAGAFFFGPFSLDFSPPPPQITGVRDNTTGSTTINVGTSGYLSIYGFALTAWGESIPPVISADDQSLTFYAANDNQVNVSYTVANNARIGQHSVWVTTEAGTSNTGTYMVYDATPVVTGIAPNTFQAGNTYPGVVISGFHLGAACPTVTISGVGTSTFTPTLCSDSSVTGRVSIDPNAPTNVNGTVTISSNGYGSGFQGAPGQLSQTSTSITIVPPPATISLSWITLPSLTSQASPGGGTFSLSQADLVSGAHTVVTFAPGVLPTMNPAAITLSDPATTGGPSTPGALTTVTVKYTTATGTVASQAFNVSTFGLS